MRSRAKGLKGPELAYLHIGKTAGTQIKFIFARLQWQGVKLTSFGHGKRLLDIPAGIPYFFSVRHPISRFVSGFYERKRQGGRVYKNQWSSFEARAFADFDHANELAEALFSDGEIGRRAREAILSISHTSMLQVDYFKRAGHFLQERPPLAIIRQENFHEDLQSLLSILGIETAVSTLVDHRKSLTRVTDYREVPRLSAMATQNLSDWYVQDIWFYRTCEEWITEERARANNQ